MLHDRMKIVTGCLGYFVGVLPEASVEASAVCPVYLSPQVKRTEYSTFSCGGPIGGCVDGTTFWITIVVEAFAKLFEAHFAGENN